MIGFLKICYHGTDWFHAACILREGFREGTYFAKHLEDAIEYGGPCVFGVAFGAAELPPHWQFVARGRIPASRIVHYRVHHVCSMLVDDGLWAKVLESNLALGQDHCDEG